MTATSALQTVPVNVGVLSQQLFAGRIPKAENERTHYGKLLDLMRIDWALRAAEHGRMMAITDISREQLQYDGHLSGVLNKRLNRLAALPWDVMPASGEALGDRFDEKKAEAYAAFVRAQLDMLPRFRQALVQLGWAIYDNRAAQELDWHYHWRQWNLIGLNWIHPRRLSFGPHRDVRVIDTRMENGDFRDVGFELNRYPYKFVVYTPQLWNDYPEREGLAIRTLYWSYFGRASVRERNILQELFGRPWRVMKMRPDAQSVSIGGNSDLMDSAFETVKALGMRNAARLPPGYDLDVIQPFSGAGQVAGEIIAHVEKVQSKLVLGSTATTDAVSTGLGSSVGNAHLSEEDLVIWSDAIRLAEIVEDQITDAIIAVNFGEEELDHAPRFIIRTEPPISREEEGNRIQKALDIGLRVGLEEAQEKLGIQEVQPGQAYIVKVQRAPGMFGVVPPAPEIVFPQGEAPPPGELAPAPSEAFNVPPGGGGQPPPASPPGGALPPGAPPPPALPAGTATQGPDVDEPDSVQALCDLMNEHQWSACEHGRKNVCEWCGIERDRKAEVGPDGEPVWIIVWRPLRKSAAPAPLLRASATDPAGDESLAESPIWLAPARAQRLLEAQQGEHVCFAAQPESVFGSPDVMVERGTDAFLAVTGALAERIVKAVTGKKTAADIRSAIDSAAGRFDTDKLAEPLQRELLHGALLGALDAAWEAENEKPIAVESFAALHPASLLLMARDTRFAGKPISEAIKAFLDRKAVTREVFDEMVDAEKRKAFTVAQAASEEMVKTVKRELVRQLATGAELSDFGKHAAARFESAGWTPANASHVETVFRTNVLGAYSGGRARQMTQPELLELRPYWQILGIKDGRQRSAHGAVHGAVLLATDPFWREAYPPFGYNCRCRVRSLSATSTEAHSRVESGTHAKFSRLPDPGFASGMGLALAG